MNQQYNQQIGIESTIMAVHGSTRFSAKHVLLKQKQTLAMRLYHLSHCFLDITCINHPKELGVPWGLNHLTLGYLRDTRNNP